MPIFLTQDQLYRLLQRELPEDVYLDGAASAGYSTADMNAVAKVLASAYTNASGIYTNYFPQYAEDRIGDWEITVFNLISDSTVSLTDRRAKVVNKLRYHPGITKRDMFNAVTSVIPALAPSGLEIIEWGCSDGGWILNESQLGISTFLNGAAGVDAVGPGLCDASPSTYGLTVAQWAFAQEEAYTYEVRIYNYTLTTDQRAAVDKVLDAGEPARSTHVITDGLTDADRIDGTT